VAKLADAPDLGFRNRRFQIMAFRFKNPLVYEVKTGVFGKTNVSLEWRVENRSF
jgi:hypothetical protein